MVKKKEKSEVEKQIETLTQLVKDLTAEVHGIKQSNRVEITDQTPTEVKTPLEEVPVQTQEQKFPIPQEYREIVDQTLNRHFGIEVKVFSDQPAFMFTIVVPKKYSNLSEEEYQMRGADLRSRVINFAEGSNGVKLWADKVFNNFVSELKAQIISDRI